MPRWDRGSSITGKIQTFLLFCSFVLLLLASLGPPVAKVFALQTFEDRPFLETNTTEALVLWIGPLGYCTSKSGCSKAEVGYDITGIFKKSPNATSDDLEAVKLVTNTFIIIPITAAIALIGFIISASGHHIGSAIWSAVCGIIVSIMSSVATGLVSGTMSLASEALKGEHFFDSSAGPGLWMLAVANIVSGFCWVLGLVECCLARSHKKRAKDVEYVPVGDVSADHQTMGYGQSQSLLANPAPVSGGHNYSDPFVNPLP